MINSNVPQAMNLGGGQILITRGLLEQLDTESQLAWILSHEMAHQLLGHLARARQRAAVASAIILIGSLAAGAFGGQLAAQGAAQLGSAAAGVGLAAFSREEEDVADLLALYIAEAAGYDPRQATGVMDRLTGLRDRYGSSLTVFSTHPSPEVRREQVRQWLSAHKEVDYSHALISTQEFAAIAAKYRTNAW
jgi:predicted Zn-dependent protease